MVYSVTAFNRAVDHENKVHDPEFARRVGFRGGLVPGVDVFAYLTHPVSERWGLEWLAGGGLEARFVQPVYDGDRISVRVAEEGAGRLRLEATNAEGTVCATGLAERSTGDPPPRAEDWPLAPLPDPRPPAAPEAFRAAPVLGSLEVTFDEAAARAQLEEVRETLPAYAAERTVHPGQLLRLADQVISANVSLPPWMHVSSRARFFARARLGDPLSVRARLVDLFEKKGHQFVSLDVLVVGPGGPVLRVAPYTAIYRPAWVD